MAVDPIDAPPARRRTPSGAPVTWTLLGAFVVVFVLGSAASGSPVFAAGAQFNPAVLAGQWWRVLTATVLHAGVTHLLFNGYALYLLGPQLERGVGSAAFAALYVASGLGGGLAFLFSAPGQVAVGASGAIFGLFGAWFAASWVNRDTPAGRAGVSQFGVLLVINMALPLFVGGIAWQAHAGGLVVGGLVGLLWARGTRQGRRWSPSDRARVPAVIAVALLGLLLATSLWYT